MGTKLAMHSVTPGGGTPGNSWLWCATRSSKSWPYFRPKNVIFHTRVQTSPISNYVIIAEIEIPTKTISEFAHFSFFLTHLDLKGWLRSYTPVVVSKIIPDSRPKWSKCIPVFRPNQLKNHTLWGGTNVYGLYEGVPPGSVIATF